MSEEFVSPRMLAFVIDNEVVEVLALPDRVADIFLQDHQNIDVSDRDVLKEGPLEGWNWDGANWSNPSAGPFFPTVYYPNLEPYPNEDPS
jgi:hypothetical protein